MAWLTADYCGVQAVIVGALLGYAAYRDVKYREVDPYYWAAAFFLASPLAVLCWAEALSSPARLAVILGNLAALGVLGVVVYLCLIGGADFFAIALVAYALPAARDGFPLALATLLYASAAEASLSIAYCVYNATANRRVAARAGGKIPYCFLGIATTVRDAWKRPWWYPLTGLEEGGGCVAEDPHEQLSRIASERGEDYVIWASPGFPFIAFILPGFVAAYLLGATPIASLLGVLTP